MSQHPRMKIDFLSPDGIKLWIRQCGFATDKEACKALKVPFRTFGRWKALGVPRQTTGSKIYSESILRRMETVLRHRIANGKAARVDKI